MENSHGRGFRNNEFIDKMKEPAYIAIIPNVVKLILKRKIIKSYHIAHTLCLNIVLCMVGLKDSYLIDNCSVDIVQVKIMLEIIRIELVKNVPKTIDPCTYRHPIVGENLPQNAHLTNDVALKFYVEYFEKVRRNGNDTKIPSCHVVVCCLNKYDYVISNTNLLLNKLAGLCEHHHANNLLNREGDEHSDADACFHTNNRNFALLPIVMDVSGSNYRCLHPHIQDMEECPGSSVEKKPLSSEFENIILQMLHMYIPLIRYLNQHFAAGSCSAVLGEIDLQTEFYVAVDGDEMGNNSSDGKNFNMCEVNHIPYNLHQTLPSCLSFPFLAGWLLGYACVYHTPSSCCNSDCNFETSSNSNSMSHSTVECLSNVPLLKYYLYTPISATKTCTNAATEGHVLKYEDHKSATCVDMDAELKLMEFTVPSGLNGLMHYDYSDQQYQHIHTLDYIEMYLDQQLQCNGNVVCDVMETSKSDKVRFCYAREVVVMPAITL